MIRAVKRYNESAKIEADILLDLASKGGAEHGIVLMKEYFFFKDMEGEHMSLVFETLGRSLYDFIKSNHYKGMRVKKMGSLVDAFRLISQFHLTHPFFCAKPKL